MDNLKIERIRKDLKNTENNLAYRREVIETALERAKRALAEYNSKAAKPL